jgi:hypothetical protein
MLRKMAISVPDDCGPISRYAGHSQRHIVRQEPCYAGGLNIGFNANALADYSGLITIHPFGYNSSGFNGALPDIVLSLEAEVVSGQAVPEPSTVILLVSGLGAMAGLRRMRKMVRGK